MKGELKHVIKLMWGNKRMRSAFGCSLGLLGFSGIVLLQVICMAASIGFLAFGKHPESFSIGIFLKVALGTTFMAEVLIPYAAYTTSRKGMRMLPLIKGVLTKGILFNLLIFFEGSMFTAILLYQLGIAIMIPEQGMLDDILVFWGMIFFFVAVVRMVCAMFGFCCNDFQKSQGGVFYVTPLVVPFDFFGEISMNLRDALLLHIVFVLAGSVCYYCYLKKKYKKREIYFNVYSESELS